MKNKNTTEIFMSPIFCILFVKMENWKPSDLRKAIVQIYGCCLSIGGIWLLVTASKIESNTTLKITFKDLGTELKTGQIGLVLIFIGSMLVFMPSIVVGTKSNQEARPWYKTSRVQKAGIVLLIVVICSAIISILSYFKIEHISIVAAFIAGTVPFAIIRLLNTED